ncbi:DUF4190 domain-containing protein [Jeotgalibacillus marinus]|uniref:DUF4190 domain-containing protein n=1 Tax=Jeotgalibacillus marinus TaxID=86667 RepID=A0ABV3Q7N9_9BACL
MVETIQTNTKSVISLTLGILSILIPVIGLMLGIIGLFMYRISKQEIAKTNENGKGLAIAGFICSISGIIIQFFFIMSILTVYSFVQ